MLHKRQIIADHIFPFCELWIKFTEYLEKKIVLTLKFINKLEETLWLRKSMKKLITIIIIQSYYTLFFLFFTLKMLVTNINIVYTPLH